MSLPFSRQIMPSPKDSTSRTDARRVVRQTHSHTGELQVLYSLEVDEDYDQVILNTHSNTEMIVGYLTYDTAYALYMALSDALDDLEENMIPTPDEGTPEEEGLVILPH